MYFPSLADVRELAATGAGNLVPIYREVTADLDTPVSAFLKVRRGRHSFLLESVEGGERLSRYSFIGTEPYRIVRTGPGEGCEIDPLRLLEEELSRFKVVAVGDLPPFDGGAVGYLSYEAARYFERLPVPEADELGLPEAMLLFVDTILVFDHLRHRIKVVSHVRLDGDIDAAYRLAQFKIDQIVERLQQPLRYTPRLQGELHLNGRVESNVGREGFEASVLATKEYVVAGDVIQGVLSQRLARSTPAPAFEVYRALRQVNPSPYMYYLELGDFEIVGASPEMLVRVEDGLVETHPIAGTRPRGHDLEEDQRLEQELRHDEKELAEHTMLLDLGRNDVGRVARPGSVRVTQMFEIERYSHVMHLVSHVTGQLRDDLTPYDALRACFPAGTVSGAPKIRAMEIIAELEPDRRGPYAGAVGCFSFNGNLDTCITIRTLVMKDGVAYTQAGAGIVFDSDPTAEHQECLSKARALIRAIDLAEQQLEALPSGSLGY
ncbi:MAG TPA: anthranilate synthase component I [Dehalococcoidia bacterium]|nr:anthranilate synthase component I [Dehalococcoidia bacterium]